MGVKPADFPLDIVIWDLDGTLVHSLPATFAAFNAGLEPLLGRRLSDQEILSHFGPPDQEIIRALVGDERAEACYQDVLSHMVRNIRDMRVFDGVREALDAVETLGLRNAIFTGRGRISTDIIMKELGLAPSFAMLVTNDDVTRHKPHPEGILKICAELGSKPERTVMVGDSNADVRCGRDAGTRTVGIRWSPHAALFHSAEHRPDRVAEQPRDVVAWLRGFNRA